MAEPVSQLSTCPCAVSVIGFRLRSDHLFCVRCLLSLLGMLNIQFSDQMIARFARYCDLRARSVTCVTILLFGNYCR